MNLAYDDRGSGDPVLFIAGRGGAGRTWHLHQVPEFQRAGYRCITFDNRGIGATEKPTASASRQMVADTAALIEKLDAAPVRIVSVSMGSYIAQELMLARPELVRAAVLMATRGREDRTREFFRSAERELADAGIELPASYDAKATAAGELFAEDAQRRQRGTRLDRHVHHVADASRRRACAAQTRRRPEREPAACLPKYYDAGAGHRVRRRPRAAAAPRPRGRRRAAASGRYLEIADTGHLGFIEKPQEVNAAVLKFFADSL